jgi:hypothetical protein
MPANCSRLVVLALALPYWVSAADACGDKFIVGTAGGRPEQTLVASVPARILIYRDAPSNTASAMTDPELLSALKQAGHTAVAADGKADFESAVSSAQYDLVLVDYASAQAVRDELVKSSPAPRVVPVLDRASRKFLSAAKQNFTVVMNVPATVSSVLSTIDKAMAGR